MLYMVGALCIKDDPGFHTLADNLNRKGQRVNLADNLSCTIENFFHNGSPCFCPPSVCFS